MYTTTHIQQHLNNNTSTIPYIYNTIYFNTYLLSNTQHHTDTTIDVLLYIQPYIYNGCYTTVLMQPHIYNIYNNRSTETYIQHITCTIIYTTACLQHHVPNNRDITQYLHTNTYTTTSMPTHLYNNIYTTTYIQQHLYNNTYTPAHIQQHLYSNHTTPHI